MNKTLISEEYKRLNASLHDDNANYGVSGQNWADMVRGLSARVGTTDILDYGCGKQTLQAALTEFKLKHYDPGIAGFDTPPAPADLVVCTDVLEHIEPGLLGNVLDDLQRVTRKMGFFTVATRPAIKFLADGRNAHLIQEPIDWWLPKFRARFKVVQSQDMGGAEFFVVVRPKTKLQQLVSGLFARNK
jgi:hypothetical protein